MIAAEPTPARDPGKASLDHPSSGQGAEPLGKKLVPIDLLSLGHEQTALGHGEGLDRLHDPAQMDFHPNDEVAAIMAIPPDQLHPGKALFERLYQQAASFLVGAMGSRHFDLHQMAQAIDERVPFASPNFFSPCHSLFQDHEPHSF